jgi:hypothetical protein
MPRRRLLTLTCVLLLLTALVAQEEKQDKKILKNADVLLMVQNHFDDDTLVKIIEVSDSDFDISGNALIDLKKQGVSSQVLRAMLTAVQKKHMANQAPVDAETSPSSASASAPAQQTPANETKPATAPAEASSPAFATRTDGDAPVSTSPAPTSNSAPIARSGMTSRAMPMGIDPQQLAAMQSQLASMGMGGMMGAMGAMGGMGGSMYTSYSPEQMPHVFLKLGPNQGRQEISPSTAQIGQSKYKGSMGAGGMALRSLATEGLSFAAMGAGPAGMMAMSVFSMGSGFMPGMRPGAPKMTYVWGLPGRNSSRELTDTNPMFELNYGDIPGVDPDAYEPAVLKLVQSKDNYRLVGATQIKMTTKNMMAGASPENGKWISEERWPSRVNKEERGFYILHVNTPLEPGDYAVVLRPVKGYKETPSGLGGHAQVFYSVWDFSVPGATPDDGKKKKKK